MLVDDAAGYVRMMARYNAWQNRKPLAAAADGCRWTMLQGRSRRLLRLDPGTLNHLLWADRIWMSRFRPDLCPPRGDRRKRGAVPDDWGSGTPSASPLDGRSLSWAEGLHAVG